MSAGRFLPEAVPHAFERIQALALFYPDAIVLDRLDADFAGGGVTAAGRVDLPPGLGAELPVRASPPSGMTLRYPAGWLLRGDADLSLASTPEGRQLRGEVRLDRAFYLQELALSPAQLIQRLLTKGRIEEVTTDDVLATTSLGVGVKAPRALRIRNNVASVTGGGELTLRGSLARPVVFGEVVIDPGGKVNYGGNEYDLVRARILFANPTRIEPVLDVVARARIEPYVVSVLLDGPISKLSTTFTSEPPLPDLDVLGLIASGSPLDPGTLSGVGADGRRRRRSRRSDPGGRNVALRPGGLAALLPGQSPVRPRHPAHQSAYRRRLGFDGSSDRRQARVEADLRHLFVRSVDDRPADPAGGVAADGRDDARAHAERQRLLRRRRALGVPVLRSSGWSATLAAACLGLAATAAARSDPVSTAALAPTVRRVEIRSDGAIDLSEVRALVAIVPGAPLSPEAVRDTLARLRLAGLASEVEVFVRPAPEGVDAVVLLWADIQVDAVELTGAVPGSRARLEGMIEQRAGRSLREDRVVRAVYALQEALADDGYLDVRVRLDVAVDSERKRARIGYDIEPGARWQVGEVRIDAGDGVEVGSLLAALRSGPGDPYRRRLLREEPERLVRVLVEAGYRQARVETLPEARDEGDHSVDLAYSVVRGPRFELDLVGAERKDLEKRDLLPFLDAAGYDEALLLQSVALIRKHYQERGHWKVAVETTEERSDELLRVRMAIEPGAKFVLDEIELEGNESLSDDQLRRRMGLEPRRALAPGSGRLVEEQLTADLTNLRSFYAVQGFGQAKVGPARVEEPGGDRLRLVVPIEEGPRRRIGEIQFSGNVEVSRQELVSALRLAAGGPYHRVLVDEAIEQLRLAYERRGYRSALISASVEWNPSSELASVRFSLLEGRRSTVDALVVRGNVRTPARVIRRFVPLQVGDPISSGSLLEVQRALYRLGIFSRVEVTVAGAGLQRSGGTVLVEVEEGKVLYASYGFGYDSESGARGLFNLSHANLFGRAASLTLGTLVSEREEVYRLQYRQPYLGPVPLEFRGTVYRESENHPDFDVSRRGLQLGVQRSFGRLLASLQYDYRIVALDSGVAQTEIPLVSRDARVASLSPVAFYDRRDDPIDPKRGWSLSASLERAFPAFSADSDFRKEFGQATGYVDLGKIGVLAGSVRLGAIENRLPETDPQFSDIDYVPAAERFYAGGRTSHRAFERDRLGVPGETLIVSADGKVTPLGGGGLALVSLEYRFPVFGGVGGTLFADGGNVWRRFGDIDPAEARWGVGVGVRYLSPIGPLRLEVGWKLDRKEYEPGYVWFVSIGNPF